MKTFKALGALLTYPSVELVEALPDIHAILVEEGLLDGRTRRGLRTLMQWMASQEALALEEGYVATFDRGRATSLHVFEHVHGDSRDRGQAMVDLGAMYERGGLALAPRELPDFLPALLEYASYRPMAEASETLNDCAHIVRRIGEALRGLDSPYHAVFAAILNAVGAEGLGAAPPLPTGSAMPADGGLDDDWAEQPAFGLGGADVSCSAVASGRGCGSALPLRPADVVAPRAA